MHKKSKALSAEKVLISQNYNMIVKNPFFRLRLALKDENLFEIFSLITGELNLFVYRGVNENGSWDINYLGNGLERITGYTMSEFYSEIKEWSNLIYDEDKNNFDSEHSSFFNSNGKLSLVYRIQTKSGQIKWVSDHKIVNFMENQVKFLDGLVVDITDSKESEQKISKLKEDLEDSNMALSRIIASFESDKDSMKKRLSHRMQDSLFPLIEKLSSRLIEEDNKYILDVIRNRVKNICREFDIRIKDNSHMLTPTELEICNYIMEGIPSKKIASIMSNSEETIKTHRKNIRKKLKIDRKVNLRRYLLEKS